MKGQHMALKERIEEILDLDWEKNPAKYRELIIAVYSGLSKFDLGIFTEPGRFAVLRGRVDHLLAQRNVRVNLEDKRIIEEIKQYLETPGAMKKTLVEVNDASAETEEEGSPEEETLEDEEEEDVDFGDEE
jgi:hypothetical protein